MQYTYLSTMLSTLEKKFGIKSKETVRKETKTEMLKKFQAYLMSGNEIAQILFLFFLPITVKVICLFGSKHPTAKIHLCL